MTPWDLRLTARRQLARGLRAVAAAVRPEEELDLSGGWDLSASTAPAASSSPEATRARPVDDRGEPEGLTDEEAAMALMAGLSGDMGPAISARAQERSAEVDGGGEHVAKEGPAEVVEEVVAALHTIFDPEIPVDIYELGLIYGVDVREDQSVGVRMTLTSPNCPAAQSLPAEVEQKVSEVSGVTRTDVDVVFDPPWTPDLMSEAAKLELNMI